MKIIINENNVNQRVDKVLSQVLEVSRNKIANSKILCNGKPVKLSYKVMKDDEIEVELENNFEEISLEPENIKLDIVYEDEYLVVINKPYNLVVHPSDSTKNKTLVNALLYHFSNLSDKYENRNGIVHRLDKDTSGLIIIAKTNEVHDKLELMFKEHLINKTYIAILRGKYTKIDENISSYIGRDKKDRKKISENTNNPKLAMSIFSSISYNEKYSLVKVKLLTGRTHQIRVHSKKINHCIVGDHIYGKVDKINRQQLHSYMLEFTHPITNENMKIIADIPSDMKENIKKMGLEIDYAGI
ncbi:RluA family pseudouridine synthase [Caviibacter abscessus]|uniref:RluA family pseudouridine synthase n=1 Tax=Caviibacter abscessus TaxID=1766719 RepID=UPI000832D0D6|nr:RluA family pseudouridine synthase [Caviibacter abscessus]